MAVPSGFRRRGLPLLAGAVLACHLAGCGWISRRMEPGPPVDAWVADEMLDLTARTPRRMDPIVLDAAGEEVRLFAAGNETVSFQVVVDAGDQAIEGLEVTTGRLAGPGGYDLPAANLDIFRMVPVRVREYPSWYLRLSRDRPQPTDYYDALVPVTAPRGGQPYELAAGARAAFWVDVRVPHQAPPGHYSGQLTVQASERTAWTIRVDLEVYDFVLPDTPAVAAVGGFDHHRLLSALMRRDGQPYVPRLLDRREGGARRGLEILRELMLLAREHRLDLFETGLTPLLKRDPRGHVRLQWEDYDQIALPYLRGSAYPDHVGVPAWCSPVSPTWPNPEDYGGSDTDAYVQTLAEVLTQVRGHFDDIGYAGRLFAWPWRGPVGGEAYEPFVRQALRYEHSDPCTARLARLPLNPPAVTGWSVPPEYPRLADMLAPEGEWFSPAVARRLAVEPNTPLQGLWLSAGTPPHAPSLSVVAGAADARALAWLALKYPVRGILLPEVLHWPRGAALDELEGDRDRLFYPGSEVGIQGVLTSVRLKRLRRGLQDAAYIDILRRRGHDVVADAIVNSMVRYAGQAAAGDNYLDARLHGWVRDEKTWDLARRVLAEEVALAVHPDRPLPQEATAHRIAWRELNESTRAVVLERSSSIIRLPVQAGPEAALRATLVLDLWNQHARPTDVRLSLGGLPPGWRVVEGEANLPQVPAGALRTVTLSAEGPSLPRSADGRIAIPVILRDPLRPARRLDTQLAAIAAWATGRPPTIDGRLDDWPALAGNAAGGFRLLGLRGLGPDGLAARQTSARFLRDGDYLYVAIRCAEPTMDKLVARSDNRVRYEQLIARDEDLVELLLDPGRQARSPSDLYHLAIKPTGVTVCRRGIQCDPPLGPWAQWSCPATVAVRRASNEWVVEMAIPLSAFGVVADEKVWGLNVMRFATQGSESSSWTGATRNYYRPDGLGTLLLEPVGQ